MTPKPTKLLQGSGNPTISDVALRAGVSLKSVSRVINKEPHVSPKLLAKVSAAIAELKYVPDPAARSLAGLRSFTVGVLFDNPSPNYTMKVIFGAYRGCTSRGYHMRFDTMDSGLGSDKLAEQLDAVIGNGRTDGFILTPPLTDNPQVLDYLEAQNIRYVRIAPNSDAGRSPSVSIDDHAAGADVAGHLWTLGHRHIGLVNGPAEHGAAVSRRTGFLEGLKALGSDFIVQEAPGDFLFDGGMRAGAQLLALPDRPTAIFATNDDMAAGLVAAGAQRGVGVPGDVSVVGFDDSWIATSVWPYLTTIHQPIEEMAATAVDMLLRHDSAPFEERLLQYHLIERASSSSPA